MSDRELENYLSLLARFLRISPRQREEIRRELRAHLQEALDEWMTRGLTRDEAVARALDDFGDAAELAARFRFLGIRKRWLMKSAMIAASVGLAALWFGPLSIGRSSSESPTAAATRGGRVASVGGPVGTAHSGETRTTPSRDSRGATGSGVDAVARALDQTLASYSLEDRPLQQALRELAEMVKLNIAVDWEGLAQIGLDRDAPVTLILNGVKARTALELTLEAAAPQSPLAYDVRDGVVRIMTRERLVSQFSTRYYAVAEVLETSVALGSSESTAEAAERLVELIYGVVEPESWTESGGNGGAQVFNQMLIVRNSPLAHAEIEELLATLATVRAP